MKTSELSQLGIVRHRNSFLAAFVCILGTQLLGPAFDHEVLAMCLRRAPFHQTPTVWSASQQPDWRTLAGYPGAPGFRDGPGVAAQFAAPLAVCSDAAANIYVADTGNHLIRKISATGTVSTLAGTPGLSGSRDGLATNALFNSPKALALDLENNLYVADVADSGNSVIRKIDQNGMVSTFMGQPGLFGSVAGMVVDAQGNLYVSDDAYSVIRKISPAGLVTTFVGREGMPGYRDGIGTNALFSGPAGLALDVGNNLYVADAGNSLIRKVSPTGIVVTVAGSPGIVGYLDAFGTNGLFDFSAFASLTIDSNGDLYIADGSQTIRKLRPNGWVSTIAGAPSPEWSNSQTEDIDGLAPFARFASPSSLASDSRGHLLVADSVSSTIRYGSLQVEQRPRLLTQPVQQTAVIGSTATFRILAQSASPLAYQWWVNGSPITGATNSFLVLSNLKQTDAGEYRIAVSDGLGYVLSSPATLTVNGNSALANWRPISSLSLQNIQGMAYGNGRYVAVGDRGAIAHSVDGIQWTTPPPGTMQNLNAVAFGNGAFVAVGGGGVVLRATDPSSWTVDSISPEGAPDLRGLTFDQGLFVAAGGDVNGSLWVSADGITWTNAILDFGVSFMAVASGAGRFVAAGNTIMTSTNGTDWEAANTPLEMIGQNIVLAHLAYGNGTFVATEDANGNSCNPALGVVLASSTGLDWHDITPSHGPLLSRVTYGNGQFVALDDQGEVFVSSNGLAFGYAGQPSAGSTDVAFANGLFVMTDQGQFPLTSSDARSWVPRTQGMPFLPDKLIQVGSRYFGCSRSWVGIEISTNATDWDLILTNDAFSDVVYGSGTLVAVGWNDTIISSSDGDENWTDRSIQPAMGSLNQVVFAAGLFVAVGGSAQGQAHILTSVDGADWQLANISGSAGIVDVAYGNGLYVAVGGDTIFESTDAQSWNVATNIGHAEFTSVAFGNNRFVAGGLQNEFTSIDGKTWASVPGASPVGGDNLTFGNGLFLAADWTGGIFSSVDGLKWTQIGVPTIVEIVGVGEGSFFAVGDDGRLYQSDSLVEQLGNPRLLSSGQLQCTITGPIGVDYRIEYSDDLRTWQTLTTVSNAPASSEFRDSGAQGRSNRFYRTVTY